MKDDKSEVSMYYLQQQPVTYQKVPDVYRVKVRSKLLDWVIKKLLKHRLIEQHEESSCLQYERIALTRDDFASIESYVYRLYCLYQLHSGKYPTEVIMGLDYYHKLKSESDQKNLTITRYYGPMDFSGKIKIMGLNVIVLPWMDGIIVK